MDMRLPPSTPQPQADASKSNGGLSKPFKCPGSSVGPRVSTKPARKRRKVDYSGADGDTKEDEKPWSNDERLALANRDVNRYGVFKVKDKETTFKRRFAVPLLNKDISGYSASRAVPALGMRTGATFIAKPLHDPGGEFSIVLFDPTVDDKPIIDKTSDKAADEVEKPKLDVPLMHKTLADILGLKKQVNDRPRVPVVIDPRLAKVLRPHQVEGVKVRSLCPQGHLCGSSCPFS